MNLSPPGPQEPPRSAARRTSGQRILGSVFSNAAGFAIRLLTVLLTTPFFIGALGKETYGSWVVLWNLVYYLLILDLGLGLAIRRFVARALATGERQEIDRRFSACLSVYLVLGALVLAAGLPLVGTLHRILQLAPNVSPIAWKIGAIMVLDVALSFPLNAFQGLLTAYQRYELTNAIRVGMEVVRNVALILAARSGWGLVALALLHFSTSVMTLILVYLASTRVAAPLSIRLFHLDRKMLTEILGYSGWVVAYLASQQVLTLSAAPIVGIFVNAAAAAEFYVAFRLVGYLIQLPTLMTNVLVPLASEREAQADWSSLRRVFLVGSNAHAFLMAPAVIGAWFLGGAFFQLWLGDQFTQASRYLLLLLLPVALAQGTASSIALGTGRQRGLTLISVAAAAVTITAAVAVARSLNAREATLGVSAVYGTVGIFSNLAIYVYACRFLGIDLVLSFVRIWRGPLLAGIPMALAVGWARSFLRPEESIIRLALAVATGLVVYGAASAAIVALRPGVLPAISKLGEVLGRRWPRFLLQKR